MPEIKNTFLKGKMNKDADERVLPSGEYRDALNIQVGVSENGDAGSLHNILGNSKISSINISGAKCIGSIANTENEKIYWFIYGTSVNAIAEYDETTNTVSPVLVDTTKLITNFPNTQITAINVIDGYLFWTDGYSEPKIIDINLFKAKSTNFSTTTKIFDDFTLLDRDITEADITLIKKKPSSAPTVTSNTYGEIAQSSGTDITVTADFTGINNGDTHTVTVSADPGFDVNQVFFIITNTNIKTHECKFKSIAGSTLTLEAINVNAAYAASFTGKIAFGEPLFEDKFVRFAYRWKFKNNQLSIFSPFTEPIFEPKLYFDYNIEKGYNNSMLNQIRFIELDNIDVTPTDVESIDILYKESNNTNIYVYKTLKKEDFTNYNTGSGKIKIDSESVYSIVPENQLLRQYDNIPYKAKAAEITGNRIILGNYTDGLNVTLNSSTGNYINFNPTFNVSTIARTTDQIKSIKTGRTYQIGVVFEDEYGRQTPVFSNNTGSIKVPFNTVENGLSGKALQVSMSSLPVGTIFDNRIAKFKYYIKENSQEYYNIIVKEALEDEEDTSFIWLVIPSYEINKIQEEDYILYKKPKDYTIISSSPIADASAKYKAISISNSKPDSINTTTYPDDYSGYFFVKIKKDTIITAATDLIPSPPPGGNEDYAVFETLPKENILDLYYETEESYSIGDYNKTKTLRWFNCFNFGNGLESDRIRDDFNEVTIDNQVRVSTTIEDIFKEKENKYSLIFSGIYNSRNAVNNLNQFNVGENITKDLNPEYGSIQKLHTRDTNILAFCEDKILKILANKDALFNADGNVNLTSTNAVLGQAVPYSGEFGISTNPESFANYGYQVYFTDKARNAVLRLSMDGLTVISNYGMSDFFRDKFNLETLEESIAFKEGIDGWTSRLSFVPESGLSLNGKYYTFKSGELWKNYNNGTNYNNFYNTQYDSKVKFIYNQDPSSIKSFKTLGYEGTANWYADSIETDAQSGKVPTFINKEGKWFNQIQGIETNTSNIDPKEFSIQGLGNISSYSGVLSDESSTTPPSSETLITPENIIGTYDIYSKQYVLSFTTKPTFVEITDCSFSINIIPEFECSYSGLSVADGQTGDAVVATVTEGTIGTITPSTYQAGSNTYSVQITAPAGYTNAGSVVTCTDTATGALPLFECADASLSIPDGTIGATVTGTVAAGTIQSISPTTYSSGSNPYTATILVPSGYSNSGSTIDCADNATGTAAAYAEITGPTSGTVGSNITLVGEDQNFTGSTWAWANGSAAGSTSKSITFTESSAGTITYEVTIDSSYTDTHDVVWSTAPPTLTCGTTGFNLSDGNTGDTITASDYTITNGTVINVYQQGTTDNTYAAGLTTYDVSIQVPAGYSNAGATLACTATATGLNEFTCSDAGFAVADGTTGDTIGIGTDATVVAGTLNSVSPSTYQSGSNPYTANITVPSGYSNSGSALTTCTDNATGSTPSGSTYTQYIVLSEAVSENPTYTATWPIGTQTVSTGDLGPKTKTVTLSGSSVLVSISRTSPDATVEDATQIQFSRNSDAVEYTVNKSIGDSVTTESYTFTGVNSGDILKISIAEG